MKKSPSSPKQLAEINGISKSRKTISTKVTAIVGFSKNAGKTSLLNWLVRKDKSSKIGIITTGRDGEALDSVYGHKKPEVRIPTRTYFTTFDYVIEEHSSYLEVIEKLPYRTSGKCLWLVKTLKDIETEIVGPVSVKEQIELIRMLKEKELQHIYVDGSLDRKSIILSECIDNVYIVVNPDFGNFAKISKELNRLLIQQKFPLFTDNLHPGEKISLFQKQEWQNIDISSIFSHESEIAVYLTKPEVEKIYFPGSLLENSFQKLKNDLINCQGEIIFSHPYKLFLNFEQLAALKNRAKISFLHKPNFKAIAINSYSVKGNHVDCISFRRKLREQFPKIPIIDIQEVNFAKRK